MNNSHCLVKNMDAENKRLLIETLSAVINEQRQVLLQQILAQRTRYLTVVLEDIYQAQNASAVIRTAECLGLQEMHIIEHKHEYQINPKVVQGASKWMEINRYKKPGKDNTTECLQKLKNRGYKIIAMTLREDSIDLNTVKLDQKLALCFGSEEPGLTDVAHGLADEYIKIPMNGFTQSFNLSVSAGICLHRLAEKMRDSDYPWQLSEEDKTILYIDWLSKSTPTGKLLLDSFIENNNLQA